jgi:uncharacterized membrane protein YeaQ/YmgE (transglycosylase-associated protein family)
MDLVVTVLIGLAVGVMVELLLPGHTFAELVLAMFLGIAGALLARLTGIWENFFVAEDPGEYIGAMLGAIVVLLLYGVVFRRWWKRKGPRA